MSKQFKGAPYGASFFFFSIDFSAVKLYNKAIINYKENGI